MYNIFKRPMFKMGGMTQGTGIMSHVEPRPQYFGGGRIMAAYGYNPLQIGYSPIGQIGYTPRIGYTPTGTSISSSPINTITDIEALKSVAVKNQFINFDEVVRKQVHDAVAPNWYTDAAIEIDVKATPDGESKQIEIVKEDLFSSHRYIRMDLAVDILNKIGSLDANHRPHVQLKMMLVLGIKV